MRRSARLIPTLILTANLVLALGSDRAVAQEMEIIAGGEIDYQNYCAVCHGIDGKGEGIMSRFLTARPADLTQMTKKNGGTFPFWRTYRVIEGREEMRGHGSRAQSSGRLIGLVFYLQYIQE